MCHHESEFQCQSDGSCVPSTWECDGHPDCEDGSDEHHACPPRTCPSSLFRCDNGNCVLHSWICDGDNDCRDMSDERDCPTPPFQCPSWQWQCPGHSVCINLTTVCDNTPDCPNGADESPLCSKSDVCFRSQPWTCSLPFRKTLLFYYISEFAGLLKFMTNRIKLSIDLVQFDILPVPVFCKLKGLNFTEMLRLMLSVCLWILVLKSGMCVIWPVLTWKLSVIFLSCLSHCFQTSLCQVGTNSQSLVEMLQVVLIHFQQTVSLLTMLIYRFVLKHNERIMLLVEYVW